MNNLFRHIEYLILHHDCVIVPGLGAFIATSQSAQIDFSKGTIIPPYRTVMFNQAVTLDDGLLANSYARKYSLSFEEARQIILREVATLKSSLLTSKEVKIGSLGVLMLGEEDKLLFFPSHLSSEIGEKLGFQTVSFLKPMKNEPQDNISGAEDVESKTGSRRNRTVNLNLSRTFGKIAVALAVFATIALAIIYHPTPKDSREQRASVVPVEALIPSASKNEVRSEVKQDITESSVVESSIVAEPVQETVPSFYLIVATFSTSKEAETYAGKYSSSEYPLEVISSKTLTRVAVASSDDKAYLQKQLNSAAITSRFPNAWIWRR